MLVFEGQDEFENGYLPSYDLTEQEENILYMDPSLWIESTSGVNVSGTNVTSIDDRSGNTSWLPLNPSVFPRVINSEKGTPVLNFGLGRGPSAPGAVLAAGEYEAIPQHGVFVLAMVYRIPLRLQGGYQGTGGNILGNNDTSPNLMALRFRDDAYTGTALWMNHGTNSPVTDNNYPLNTTFVDDGIWHTAYIEITPEHHLIEIDGVLRQKKAAPAIPFNTPASRQLIIGGAGSPFRNGFFGDLAMMLIVPGLASLDERAIIYDRLNAVKAKL
ncbi:hypothetical protein KIF75_02980 [Serratia ureilytica]|uniref:LamG domain-containing protein n=1 Tax=Serratia ureilytica TaxID=300181 RepID=UPI001BD18AA0|nr:LamG domain-containing protein [Serratia ureilytica]MBS7518646.1 hypothetical protein [Serratia ureilytica]